MWLGMGVGVILASILIFAQRVVSISHTAALLLAVGLPIVTGAVLGIWLGKMKAGTSNRA